MSGRGLSVKEGRRAADPLVRGRRPSGAPAARPGTESSPGPGFPGCPAQRGG